MVDKNETDWKARCALLEDSLAMEKAKNTEAMSVVRDGSDAIQQMKDEKIQLERQAKEPLIKGLCKDSLGHFTESDLSRLTLDALQALRFNFEGEIARAYHDWLLARQQRDEARARTRCGTIGTYNQETGKWENGTDEGVV